MKFALKTILSLIAAVLVFLAGMSYERSVRTEKIMSKWQELYSWTDEEGKTFFDLVAGIEISPEEAADLIGNIAKFGAAQQKMMENDQSMMVAVCYRILRLLEEDNHQAIRDFCLDRIEFYYHLPNDDLPDMLREGSDALKLRIEALAKDIPDLMMRISGQPDGGINSESLRSSP